MTRPRSRVRWRRPQGWWGRGPFAALASAAVLVGCTAADADSGASVAGRAGATPLIVTSTTVLADLITAVVADNVEVRSLVPPGGDPHGYEPTPGDVRLVRGADLVVVNGLGLEPGLAPVLRQVEGVLHVGDVVAIDATTSVALRVVDGEVDPHLWMVPTLAARYVDAIAESVARVWPELAEPARRRARDFAASMQALEDELAAVLADVPEANRVIVTSHDSQGYFADRFGFRVLTLVGVSTEEVPSARQQARIVSEVRDVGVPTVFLEEHVAPGMMRAIARDAGARVGGVLFGDSLADLGDPAGGPSDYAAMMRWNARVLVEGLGGDRTP